MTVMICHVVLCLPKRSAGKNAQESAVKIARTSSRAADPAASTGGVSQTIVVCLGFSVCDRCVVIGMNMPRMGRRRCPSVEMPLLRPVDALS